MFSMVISWMRFYPGKINYNLQPRYVLSSTIWVWVSTFFDVLTTMTWPKMHVSECLPVVGGDDCINSHWCAPMAGSVPNTCYSFKLYKRNIKETLFNFPKEYRYFKVKNLHSYAAGIWAHFYMTSKLMITVILFFVSWTCKSQTVLPRRSSSRWTLACEMR